MSIDLPHLLRKSGALLDGHFRLSSGLHSNAYVQCARLLEHPRHAADLGQQLAAELRNFEPQRIVAPALGGVIIGWTVATALDLPMIFTERKEGAMQLRRGFQIAPGERIVIIEDVVTTGKSTRETASAVAERGGDVVAYGSILNRSGATNPFDRPFAALMNLDLGTWRAEECPMCASGTPLDTPGSRFSS